MKSGHALFALLALATLLSACTSDGDPEPTPAPPPDTPANGTGEGGSTSLIPGPANLLNQPGRRALYQDLDNLTRRFVEARSEGKIATAESLRRTMLRPKVNENLADLTRTARSPEEPVLRVIAVRSLGFGADAARIGPVLLEILTLDDTNLVSSALVSLYILGSPETPLAPLVTLLRHPDSDVRSNDALALMAVLRARRQEGRVPGTDEVREASGRLFEIVSNMSEDSFVRGHAAAALGAIGDPAATDVLTNLLADESSAVRARAAMGLGQLGQESAILPLIEALAASTTRNESIVITAAITEIAKTRNLYCDTEALGTRAARWRDWYAAIRE